MRVLPEQLQKINKYTNIILPVLLIVTDYIAIISAEGFAFWFRNSFVGNNSLHISWLNFWVVFPWLYIIFLNIEQLYNRRAQFWQIIQKLFVTSCYAITAIIILLYIARIAASTLSLIHISPRRSFYRPIRQLRQTGHRMGRSCQKAPALPRHEPGNCKLQKIENLK